MNMLTRPDLVQSIEILDGDDFVQTSLAQFCFRVISAADAKGYSLTLEGEVFSDAISINGLGEIERTDEYGNHYGDDIMARRLVAANLFGYEAPMQADTFQPVLFETGPHASV